MSFRERSAWITLVTVLVCFGVYFSARLTGLVSRHGFGLFHLFVACMAALALLQLVLHAVASRLSPGEAKAPLDERERLIQLRSHTVGYYVLVAGVLAIFLPGHMGFDAFDLLNFALFALVAAFVAVSAAQIIMFRRGA